MEVTHDPFACENESCESSDSRHADPCPHSLFTKNDCHLRGLSCRELSIHRSGSQSYIDNFPLVSRACQSFLASSRPRQDFTLCMPEGRSRHNRYIGLQAFFARYVTRAGRGMCRGKLTFARAARPPLRTDLRFAVRASNVIPLNVCSLYARSLDNSI